MFFNVGENPRGVWQLKITDNNNLEQNELDSQQETDVEDLEERVIDEKSKQQKEKWREARLQVKIQFHITSED